MKILVLSWEFPPRLVGGIARHVAELYPEIVKLGHDIHLVTLTAEKALPYEIVDGIHVHRLLVAHGQDFFHWVVNINEKMGQYGGELIQKEGNFDIIHAHDWLVGDAAIALKHYFKVPLIATIHATEYGRYNGLYTPIHHYIASKEGALIYNAWRVIVCSHYMRYELQRAFGTPWDKIDVIYNGIRPEKKEKDENFDYQAFRRYFADDCQKIIYYVGRMTYEKGVQVLLDATPKILAEMQGNLKIIIIGGGDTGHLQHKAWHLGVWNKCQFTGFMSDEDLNKFQIIANCAVFPSLYEPFGIVALESFAARVPVVVSDTGGLPEVVHHGQTGIVTQANNPQSLAWGVLEVLRNPDYGQSLVENAYQDLERRFNWAKLAQETEKVYDLVLKQYSIVQW